MKAHIEQQPNRVRFAWSTLVVLGVAYAIWVAIALAVGGFEQVLNDGPASGGFVVILAMIVAGALAAINFIFFDYVSIDEAECRQIGWFGLRRKSLPICQIRGIEHARRLGRHWIFDLVVIHGSSDSIELNMEYRWPGEVRRAVRYLVSRGIPADDWVTQRFVIAGAKIELAEPR